jgi:hypothetical protein
MCGKTFKQQSNFNAHVKIHANPTEHCCGVCQKTFMWMRSLDKHRLVHNNIKKLKLCCRYCARAFRYAPESNGSISAVSRMDFAAHEQSHTVARFVLN